MEWYKDDYRITTDKSGIDVTYVHAFLSQSYWAANIPRETVERSIAGSLCFSIFHQHTQVGFARVITDEATFAYLADVFIDSEYRGRGLSKWLMGSIMAYPSLQGLRRFMLATATPTACITNTALVPLPIPTDGCRSTTRTCTGTKVKSEKSKLKTKAAYSKSVLPLLTFNF